MSVNIATSAGVIGGWSGIPAITSALSTASADIPSSVTRDPTRWMSRAPAIAPPTPPKLNAASALLASTCGKPAAVSIATIQLKPT